MLGQYRVELPLLPFEFAREVERGKYEVDRFKLAKGRKSRVDVNERGFPVVVLDVAARAELVQQLDALREAELTWRSVTFVFKPLV